MEQIKFETKTLNIKTLLLEFLKKRRFGKGLNEKGIEFINKNEINCIVDNNIVYKINTEVEVESNCGENFICNIEDYVEENDFDYLLLFIEKDKKIQIYRKRKLLKWLSNNNGNQENKLERMTDEELYEIEYTYTEDDKNKKLIDYEIKITPTQFSYYKKIEDIRFLIKKENKLTYLIIEEQLSQIPFNKYYDLHGRFTKKNEIFEDKAKVPQFSYIYYFLLCVHERIPHPNEVVILYISAFCEKTEDGNYVFKDRENDEILKNLVLTRKELEKRICCAFNSFNREIHLMYKLRERNINFYYSSKLDIEKGIDILVIDNEEICGIKVTQDSKQAKEKQERKDNIRHDYSNIRTITLMKNSKNTYPIGDIDVFTDKTIENLIKEIRNEPIIKDDFDPITDEGIEESLYIFSDK